ncbi:MAG: hypothetical protein M3N95_16660 [Actinomycetota bacterium]|nr:hypothetical protein [Actinomycetota bacterium]
MPATFAKDLAAGPNWIGDSNAVAVLFYAPTADITIGTHGTSGVGRTSKILWFVAGSPAEPLTMRARNLTTGSRVVQTFEGAGGYPSIPLLPDAGCWDLLETVGARTVMDIVLIAQNRS